MKINLSSLRQYCSMDELEFYSCGQLLDKIEPLIYIDRKSSILGIAHLDYVTLPFSYVVRHGRVHSPRLDNRLGVYLLLDFLPSIGINCDVLLTTGEESCRSSAYQFTTTRKYKWMFQFDRSGLDCVLYQYMSSVNQSILGDYFPSVGHGSYSDIVDLDHLGISGLNVGNGTYFPHSVNMFCDLPELCLQIRRFKRFYNDYKDVTLRHDPRKKDTIRYWGGSWYHQLDDNKLDDDPIQSADDDPSWSNCEICGGVFSVDDLIDNTCDDCRYYTLEDGKYSAT